MERNVKVLPPELLMDPLLGLLEDVESVPLVISGNSMNPFLVHGRDTVYLSKVKHPLKKGDMILYRRDNGAYILHRICQVDGETYTLVGDAQTQLEPGVRQDQVLAVVNAVCRKGKILRSGNFWWDFFAQIWIRMIPLRPAAVAAYSRLMG
jgi:hypothetical protein